MFAFASTFASVQKSTSNRVWRVCFDRILPLRDAFDHLSEWPQCSPEDVIELLDPHIHMEASYAKYDDRIPRVFPLNRHIVVDRFLQSWRYFTGFESEIRQLFHFTDSIHDRAHKVLTQAIEELVDCRNCHGNIDDIIAIGVHIRRGDMARQEHLRDLGYVTANALYLDRAMNYMDQHLQVNEHHVEQGHHRQRRVFVICSDDIAWSRKNVPSRWSRDVVFVSTRDAVVDLAVLAQCRHSIITVGTFGWWAAWLANGTTVYMKDWPRIGSVLYQHVNHADYFPPHWVAL
jgi:galactoside 2-L-fucosyltransferase 1/2